MSIVLDGIAREIATLSRAVDAPTGDLGYGTDLSCVTDVTPSMDEVDPQSTRAIGEALLRRYQTPRSKLADDPDYGLDCRGMLNRGITTTELRVLSAQVHGEAVKDDRVDSAIAEVTFDDGALRVAIAVMPVDRTLGTFTLTFAVTDGGLLLEAIG